MEIKYILVFLLVLIGLAIAFVYLGTPSERPHTTVTPSSTTPAFPASTPLTATKSPLVPEWRVVKIVVNGSAMVFKESIHYGGVNTGNACTRILPRIEPSLLQEINEKYLRGISHSTVSIECLPNGSVEVGFRVYNKVWVSDGQQYADFLWFLTPNSLDLIENHFTELRNGLRWSGTLEGVPTLIEIDLPTQDVPYRAWGQPVGHCHGHAWWPLMNSSSK
ncbi:MAG: hypothetical protein J7L55_00120 [Desulfurococcales archaeon]|nr:hypothetical protein [Desulfurococcales archaeon]